MESVRSGLDLLRRGPAALAVAMSGSGPSLYALYPDLATAEAARSALAGQFDALGFASWCCRCGGSGVSLVTDGSPP